MKRRVEKYSNKNPAFRAYNCMEGKNTSHNIGVGEIYHKT